jgi:hypothetical protein
VPAVERYLANHPDRVKRLRAERLARAQAETLERATRYRFQWTGPELELAARRDLTSKEVALMIGRTMVAVQRMRQNLDRDPAKQFLAGLISSPWQGSVQQPLSCRHDLDDHDDVSP